MSRGHGAIQRQVIALMADKVMMVPELAREIFKTDRPTRSQYETVRRAVNVLSGKGLLYSVDKRSRKANPQYLGIDRDWWLWTANHRLALETNRAVISHSIEWLTARGYSVPEHHTTSLAQIDAELSVVQASA